MAGCKGEGADLARCKVGAPFWRAAGKGTGWRRRRGGGAIWRASTGWEGVVAAVQRGKGERERGKQGS